MDDAIEGVEGGKVGEGGKGGKVGEGAEVGDGVEAEEEETVDWDTLGRAWRMLLTAS